MEQLKRSTMRNTILTTVACALLLATVSERGAVRAQAPAPAAQQPPASAAAAPNPAPSAEETIRQLKAVINARDHSIAQLIENGAQCRDMLNQIEEAVAAQAKKNPAPAVANQEKKAPAVPVEKP